MNTQKVSGYSFSQACDLPLAAVPYIIKGLFKDGDLVLWFGASGVFKSFVVLDAVFHVAQGWAWHGHKTNQTGVLIVLGEGQSGYLKRMKAIQTHYAVTDAPIYVAVEPVLLDGNPDDLRNIIAEAEGALGCRIGLVVFDTFSMMLNGDENSNRDVGIAFRTLRQGLEGRAAVLVHHVGHGDGNRERGAYQLRANADCRILVTRDEDGFGKVITVGHIKEKDDPLVQPLHLGFNVLELGTDADGDPVTSIVMVPTDATPNGNDGRLGKGAALVMGLIRAAGGRIHRKDLYALHKETAGSNKNIGRSLKELVDKHLIFDADPMGNFIAQEVADDSI